MARYSKKAVVIEAVELQELVGNKDQIRLSENPPWITNALATGVIFLGASDSIVRIKTLEGEMKCEVGNYILQGVKGEIYPCRADIFKETYVDAGPDDWKGRLQMEANELDDKIVKLMDAVTRQTVPKATIPMLKVQLRAMQTYYGILKIRLT